jgi:hypothetical protein
VLVFGLFALAYDVLLGHAGVLSLGHSAFLGVAAYVTGILLARYHAPLELSILAGAGGGLLTALVLGVFVLRKRGVYLAMLTLALSQVFYYIVLMWTPVTGGTDGLGNLPILYLSEPLGWRLSKRPVTRYYVIATIIVVAMLAIRHLLRSPLGRAMRAVKANETRAAACGYDTRRVRLVAFAISGFFSGLAGALLTVVLGVRADREHPLADVGHRPDHDAVRRDRHAARPVRRRRRLHLDARFPQQAPRVLGGLRRRGLRAHRALLSRRHRRHSDAARRPAPGGAGQRPGGPPAGARAAAECRAAR